MAKDTVPADIAKLGFEEALSELEKIVRRLEEGEGKLGRFDQGVRARRNVEETLPGQTPRSPDAGRENHPPVAGVRR